MTENDTADAATRVATYPIQDLAERGSDLIDTPDGPRLRGSRCAVCASASFPVHTVCLTCGSQRMIDAPLSERGTLYAFTTVHVSSSRPTPYTLGYVDLSDGVRLLADVAPDAVEQGSDTPVVLATEGTSWRFVADREKARA